MALQSAFTLTANEIYNTLANMIISQQVFADNISKHQTLVDKARVDGGLYGDTKLYYATDVLKSVAWGNDSEASNLLSLDRAEDPETWREEGEEREGGICCNGAFREPF